MPPKLVHITTVPMSLGFIRGQTGYMREQGLTIEVISSPGDQLDAFAEDEGVTAHAIPMERKITPLQDVVAVGRLVRTLRAISPDIVHAHTPKGGLLGMIAARLARVPGRIYHIRGLPYITASGRRRTLLMATERLACFLADRVFCVSHSIRDVAIRDGICPPGKIVVFGGGSGNGVDAEGRFNPDRFDAMHRTSQREKHGIAAHDRVIGFVGRLVRDKGIHELGGAWQELRDRYPNTHLVLAGSLEPQDPLDSASWQNLQSDRRVHLLGRVGDTSLCYPMFDLLVLPTYREGLPNVPLEAAAMKLPVVATDIPGCIDAVADGVTGMLVPVKDADALLEAIIGYLDDPDLRRQHGEAGRTRVLREFRQDAIWQAVYEEYRSLRLRNGVAAN